MARRKLTNPLALAVLGTVAEQPRHPYEIAQVLRSRGKEQSIKINYGSLYTVVQDLEERGLVAAAGTERKGRRPERTVYAITDAGQTELHDRLAEMLAVWEKEFPRFEAALSLLPLLAPDEVVELLGHRLRMLEVQLASWQGIMDQIGKEVVGLFLVESEYEAAMLRTEAGFIRGLIRDIRAGTLGGVAEWRAWHETGLPPQDWVEQDQIARGLPPDAARAPADGGFTRGDGTSGDGTSRDGSSRDGSNREDDTIGS